MKNILLLVIFIYGVACQNAEAQVNWKADCTNLDPPFNVIFTKNLATVFLKGWVYELPFLASGVGPKGDHGSIYGDKEMSIATVYPQNTSVVLFTIYNPIAVGNCK